MKDYCYSSSTGLAARYLQADNRTARFFLPPVINHNSGADEQEVNPLIGQSRWMKFDPKSGKFPRDWQCFHPNMYESWDEMTFGDMPDLSHRHPYVYGELLKMARWLIEEVGFDGFRYDSVKGYGANTITAIQEYRYMRDGKPFVPYGVAEFWDNARAIENWVDLANFSNSNPVDAFDCPLREMLKALCDQFGFSLRSLTTWETVLQKQPQTTVTFVENHDLRDEGRPIVNDKLLAYSYILMHEGYPSALGGRRPDGHATRLFEVPIYPSEARVRSKPFPKGSERTPSKQKPLDTIASIEEISLNGKVK